MFKVALSGGPLDGHRFEIPNEMDELACGKATPKEASLLKPGERGREVWDEGLSGDPTSIVGSYSKTKRTVSGRTVYQWNEAGV